MSTDTITLYLTVTSEQGQPRVPVELQKSATCTELRQLASTTTRIPAGSLKLIYRGRLIADSTDKLAVEEFKLESESVLHCMGKPAEPTSSNNDTTSAPTAAAATFTGGVPATPVVAASSLPAAAAPSTLDAALLRLRQQNDPAKFQTAVQTLSKILENIIQNPMEEKYRRVKKTNAAFQKRFGGLPGAEPVLFAAGFTLEAGDGEPAYVLQASPAAWPGLLQAQSTVNRAVQEAAIATAAPIMPPMGGMPGFGGMGMPAAGGGAGDPMSAMQASMAANIMSDPAALQQMLQNPMVQEMMRTDPRLAQMQPMINELSRNPAMAQQLSQMMQNPQMQQQMQQAMQQRGGGGGLPGGFPNFMPPNAGNPPPGGGNNNNNRSDDEMTEEEMIAEAIRRSLQDGGN